MRARTILVAAFAAGVTGWVVSACGAQAADDGRLDQGDSNYRDYLTEVHVTLKNGRDITCISQMTAGGSGGLSCDWVSQ